MRRLSISDMTDTNIYLQRLEQLRSLMRSEGYDAVVITGCDPHQSEYPAQRWKQVQFLTGFTPEAADVAVTLDHAGLWTDSRYFIQAEKQLRGTGYVLHKTRVPEQVLIPEWLSNTLEEGSVIAVDSLCTSEDFALQLKGKFTIAAVPDLLDELWLDRPAIPQTSIFETVAGESRRDKIEWMRGELSERGCDAILLSALDEIAWLLNVRASDIEYNPLVISYLLVSAEEVKWFVLKEPLEDSTTEETFVALQEEGIEILPYDEVFSAVASFEGRLWLDSRSASLELGDSAGTNVLFSPSPVSNRKEQKSPLEIEWIRNAHVNDGAAMEKFLYWLEKSVESGKQVSEWDAAVKLGEYRREIEDYMGDSFETVSAYGASAALPHYSTPSVGSPIIEPHGLYLCDSGGQYLTGTTDITRTVPMGECTPEEIRDYTLALKAHIDLALAVFPYGTPGCRIDAAARLPLWANLMDFGHGTGHGVGFFLCVHEGPHQIRQNTDGTPMVEGMVTSDEPGIYREGKHGVRHENLLLTEDAGRSEFGHFLKFETLTLCHFDTSILDLSLLEPREIAWLNTYNATVYHNLASLVGDEVARWLELKTRPVGLD